jgi:ribosomal protein L7Ae-like RNA K-turn-binding protein
VTTLVEKKKAQLVMIANDVNPVLRKLGVKNMSRLGRVCRRKTTSCHHTGQDSE